MSKDTLMLVEIARFNSIIYGMVAENKQREYLQNSMAYSDDCFAVERDKFDIAIRKIQDLPENL